MNTLLLVDDSVTIQRVIELTFADEGIRVIAVGDGESAIARIDQEQPDIVLADVGMPGIDGYEVATHVKQSPTLSQVPVLLLTGAFEPIDEERARATGCDGVLVKPFEPRQLIRVVRELLSGARPAELWPADMPRLEPPSTRTSPATMPIPVVPFAAAPTPAEPVELAAPDVPDDPNVVSIAYDADADTDLAAALARLELVGVPDKISEAPADQLVLDAVDDLAGPHKEPSLEWDLSAAPKAGAARTPNPEANQSLANVFSALLAAEKKNPETRASIIASPALTEAAVEEVVQKVVRRMTDELVRKIVLETAERLIREEIDRIKA